MNDKNLERIANALEALVLRKELKQRRLRGDQGVELIPITKAIRSRVELILDSQEVES